MAKRKVSNIFGKHNKNILRVLGLLVIAFLIYGFATNWKDFKGNKYSSESEGESEAQRPSESESEGESEAQRPSESESEGESENVVCSTDVEWNDYNPEVAASCDGKGNTDVKMIAKCRVSTIDEFTGSSADYTNKSKGGYAIWQQSGPYGGNTIKIELKDEQVPHCSPAPHVDFLYTWHNMEKFYPGVTQRLQTEEGLISNLESISESISVDALTGVIRIRCHHLGANFATLSLIIRHLETGFIPTNDDYKNAVMRYIGEWDNGMSDKIKTSGNTKEIYLEN